MALEQLGYQAECGPWRCAYLMGAWELLALCLEFAHGETTFRVTISRKPSQTRQ